MIGKRIGSNLYVHKSAIDRLPDDMAQQVKSFAEDCPVWDIAKITTWYGQMNAVTFLEVEGFDTLDEPILLRAHIAYKLPYGQPHTIDYSKRKRKVIYHHKWMMVDGEMYKGFNVGQSMARSTWWVYHPVARVFRERDPQFKSRIGFLDYWNDFMQEIDKYEQEKGIRGKP
jgi:hypothetical protein